MADPDHDDSYPDRPEQTFEAPPPPPGVSADAQYTGAVMAHQTRAVMRQAEANHRETMGALIALKRKAVERNGLLGGIAARFDKLHPSVQYSVVATSAYLALQLAGAGIEVITGRAPPQVTVPTSIQAAPGLISPSAEASP